MEDFQALLAWLSRRGRVGGTILVVLGLGLIGFGVVFTCGLGEDGDLATRSGRGLLGPMLVVGVVGLLLLGLGGGALFGAQGRMAREIGEDRPLQPRANPRAVAQQQPVPFWVCSECRVVEPGLSGCCTACGKTVSYVQVTREDERSIAVSSLPTG